MSWLATRRRFGLRKSLLYAGSRLLQRFVLFDYTHLMIRDAEESRPVEHSDGLECRFLSPDEVRHFAEDPANDINVNLANRLETGYDYCFAALADGKVASYCWLALDSIEAEQNRYTESPYSGIAFSFPEQYGFRYKGFTHPDFRGRRIYQRVAMEASWAMQDLGVRYLISTTECVNFAAVQSSHRSGYEFVGKLLLIGIGSRVMTLGGRLDHLGIYIGTRAKVLRRATIYRAQRGDG